MFKRGHTQANGDLIEIDTIKKELLSFNQQIKELQENVNYMIIEMFEIVEACRE